MWRDVLVDASLQGGDGDHALDAARVHRDVGPCSREKPGPRFDKAGSIIIAQYCEKLRTQLHLSVFTTFPLMDMHEHLGAVNVWDFQTEELTKTQSRAIQGRDHRVMLGIPSRGFQ